MPASFLQLLSTAARSMVSTPPASASEGAGEAASRGCRLGSRIVMAPYDYDVQSVKQRGNVMRTPGCNGSEEPGVDRKSTRLNSSHVSTSYAVFCSKKKNHANNTTRL